MKPLSMILSWLLCTITLSHGSTQKTSTSSSFINNKGPCPATNDWREMHQTILGKRDGAFLAALDQSGGSTPNALKQYGISPHDYDSGTQNHSTVQRMYDLVHDMRTRIIRDPSFVGDSILGAILFEDTMSRTIDDVPTATYLWQQKRIVPFLKIDQGLADQTNGVQLLKSMPQLDELLVKAKNGGIYGTKTRSLIHSANQEGIEAVVAQQFKIGKTILDHGLVPIIEPEVSITAPDKALCEDMLRDELLCHLDALDKNQRVMLKLTLPSTANQYQACVEHPNCLCVLALSGGYSQEQANELLRRQNGMIASFSRAFTEGLSVQQTDDEFHEILHRSIMNIVAASKT